MTRPELRKFLDGFYCGCGSPESATASLMRLLEQYASEGRDEREAAYLALPRWIPDMGLMYLALYWIDSLGLIEHGGGVLASWLTAKGEDVLEALRRESADHFEALHGTYCVHGVDVDDRTHDCQKADAEDAARAG